jgi:hypothetical protein
MGTLRHARNSLSAQLGVPPLAAIIRTSSQHVANILEIERRTKTQLRHDNSSPAFDGLRRFSPVLLALYLEFVG